jgi:hypothetical protein
MTATIATTPAWNDDYSEIVRLAYWLVNDSGEWDHLDAKEKLAELLHYMAKPWKYDDEYQLMTGTKFRCRHCDELNDVEIDDQTTCGDCADDIKADNMAADLEARLEVAMRDAEEP